MALTALAGVSLGLQALGIGASLVGGAQQDRAEERAVERQNEYNEELYDFQIEELQRKYEYDVESLKILKENKLNEIAYNEATLVNQYNYDEQVRAYNYKIALRAFKQSEENYSQQLLFNNLAAAEAYESEQRVLNEVMTSQAFQRESNMIAGLQARGTAQVGQAGNSRQRAQKLSLSESGRVVAQLNESLRSANQQYAANLRGIDLQKYGADLRANAARILEPEAAPATPKPNALPRPIFQDVYKPGKPPAPVEGVATGGNFLGAVAGGLSSASQLAGSLDSYINPRPTNIKVINT